MSTDLYNMTEESLEKFKEFLEMNKKNIKTKKLKALVFLKCSLGLVLVGAGVATLILFPSPITIAVLGGLTVLAGRKNPKKALKKIKENKKQKENIEADLISVENRLDEMKSEKKKIYPSLNPYFEDK